MIRKLAADGQAALATPRQLTRFLCGLTSPATTRAKLTRRPEFGCFAAIPFKSVMAACVQADPRRLPNTASQ